MGTYTANKELYMPTVGEQGWGDLMNTNLSTIDNFLKPITVSGSTYTFTGNQTGGSVSATSITNSGTLTSTGKITANGGIGTTSLTTSSTITSTGKITANGGIGTAALTATSISNSGNMTNTGTLTSTGKIYANGGIEGVTTLNKTVTVTPTSTSIGYAGTHVLNMCPYIPGVTYTGSIRAKGESSSVLYTWNTSNVMSTQTAGANVDKTFNFTNVISAVLVVKACLNCWATVYLVSYS